MVVIACSACGESFEYSRKDKKFCSRKCQKKSSQNSARFTQNSDLCRAKRRQNIELYDLALRLAERLYTMPNCQRLGYLNYLVNQARSKPGILREVLSNRTLLRPNPATENWKFWRGSPEYLTIAQAANRYCLHFWGYGVVTVVMNRCSEPPTGEIFEDERLAA